ncbi:ATP-binding protein [Haloarculaceae archaeon H-GB2-1]|nr:ATP-binding protein [Haloarculaceae archaeon H-GB1-1]MEA5386803.1 ATP-binding protein [Haloarculaceae archaeon H-GB11]MEA5408278.1 ATP-binding protein [Haloarculaceae archaeon H-GB2-1]
MKFSVSNDGLRLIGAVSFVALALFIGVLVYVTQQKRQRRQLDLSSNRVSMSVVDDGPGIPDIGRQTTARDVPEEHLKHSSGMGVWLVKWVTPALGGTVDIATNDPRESVVTVSFPVISNAVGSASRHVLPDISGMQHEKPTVRTQTR